MFSHIRFPDEEYMKRVSRAQSLMREKDIDGLMLTEDRHTWYFSGFGDVNPIGSRARPRILFLPAHGKPVFLVHRSTEATVREMAWFEDVRTYSDLTRAPIPEIIAVIRECGANRVGAELGREQRVNLAPNDLMELQKQTELVDASGLLWELRYIKSELEVARIEEACRITSAAYEKGFPQIRPGMTELEIGGLLSSIMAQDGAMSTWIWVVTSDYHRIDGIMRNRPVERGDLIFVDMGANVSGYWSDFSRTAVMGPPTSAQQDTYNRMVEVCDIGTELLQPGHSFSEVAAKVDREMSRRGLTFNSHADRYGHGLGMAVTEPPNVWHNEQRMIRPGMVLTMEPGMQRKDGMFHIEQNVEITATGNRLLSLARKDLIQI